MYPHRVMTRRRRLRTRTLVLSLAAALGVAVVLPALGAPDPMQQALRSWDAVIRDGRAGEPLPLQVIIVLAAPPAVSIDSPDAVKIATAGAAARPRRAHASGHRRSTCSTASSTRSTPSRRRCAPTSSRSCGRRPEVAGRLSGAQALSRPRPSPSTSPRWAQPPPDRGRAARRQGRDGRVARRPRRQRPPVPARRSLPAGTRSTASRRIRARPAGLGARHGDGRASSSAATARRACTASRRQPRCSRSRCSSCSTASLMGTTATLLAGLDRALDPNGDGNLSDHADVILAPVAEPFAAFGASAETVAARGRRARRRACSSRPPATTARPARASAPSPRPAASPGWLAVGASDGRPALPERGVDPHDRRRRQHELDDVPLAGALTPVGGSQMPLVLPAGPTASDSARAPGRHRPGQRGGRLPHRRRHQHRRRQGRPAAARRRADRAARGRRQRGGRQGARALRRRRRARGRARPRRSRDDPDRRHPRRAGRGRRGHAADGRRRRR